jgi:hypothetical protein
MDLSDWASLSTIISGGAVTASLIYLAIQTRQNTKHTRALILQGATSRTTDIMLAHQNRESTIAWLWGNKIPPTEDSIRQFQFHLMCGIAVNAMEDFFAQYSEGLMGREAFERNCETFRGLLSEPGMRAYWESRKGKIAQASPRLRTFIDGLCDGEAASFGFNV